MASANGNDILCLSLLRLTGYASCRTFIQQVGRARPAQVRPQIPLSPNGILGLPVRVRRQVGEPSQDVRRVRGAVGREGGQRRAVSQLGGQVSFAVALSFPEVLSPRLTSMICLNAPLRTDVEGCCWYVEAVLPVDHWLLVNVTDRNRLPALLRWGRGVIQTSGVCNFGKVSDQL